jgi:hypothetical protein
MVQLIDPFCGVWVGKSASFTIGQSSPPSGFSFDVASTTGWLSTSLHVTKGQELSFSAVGSWTVDFRIPNSYVGPDGYSPQVDSTIYQGCKLKLDSPQPYGVLLVRLGYDDPSPIAIGGNANLPAYRDGFLEFRIHDDCLLDNMGSVTVTVIGADKVTPSKYDAGNYAGKSGFVPVYRHDEPNDSAHDNYCGPGSSQVLISAWTSNVPDLEQLANQEHTKEHNFTYMSDMVKPINDAIGQSYYNVQDAVTQQGFSNMIGRDILDKHHPLITGIKTQGNGYTLRGWHLDPPADHIITIYGFDFRSPDVGYIYYYETASQHAGETEGGPGPKIQEYNAFWSLVFLNRVQLAGPK